MSRPVPSPSTKGMMGSSGTLRTPFAMVILEPCDMGACFFLGVWGAAGKAGPALEGRLVRGREFSRRGGANGWERPGRVNPREPGRLGQDFRHQQEVERPAFHVPEADVH